MAVGSDLTHLGAGALAAAGVAYYIETTVEDPRYRRNRALWLPLASLVAFYTVGSTVRGVV